MKKTFSECCAENGKEDLLAQWDFEKNDSIEISNISYGSNKKVSWMGKCGHKWTAIIKNRVRGNGCPTCYENMTGRKTGLKRRLIKVENDLATDYPEIAKEWHPTKNGELTPSDILSSSGTKVWL